MRIEINSGGIDAAVAVSEYQLNASSFSKGIDSIISCFKAIKTETYNLSGGIGNLQGALDEINTRIAAEEERKNNADTIRKKTNDFLDLAIRVDNQVSALVNKNQDEFYRLNPWLKPPVPESEKPWYEKAWNWLCETGEAIYEGVNNALTWIKDTAKKAWDGLVEFYEEHKKAIATVLMVVAAIAVIVLVPGGGLLATMALGAAWGTLGGAIIGGVSGGLQSVANGESFWKGAEEGAFSGAISGAIAGAAFAGIGFAGQALGKTINCLSGLGKTVKAVSTVSKTISIGMGAFDTLALADQVIDPNNNFIYNLNQKAHSSSVYNAAQMGIGVLAAFTGGMTKTMELRPGDIVYSTDIATMSISKNTITESYVKEATELVHISIKGEIITSTLEHPFLVKNKGFVCAKDLWVGAELIDINECAITVLKIEFEKAVIPVYNIRIDGNHTFYVGKSCVLVHNECNIPTENSKNFVKRVDHKDGSVTITKNIDGKNISITYTKGADGNLYPRFEKYAHPDYTNPIKLNGKMTGHYQTDVGLLKQETGIRIPKGYTMHHLEDGKSVLIVSSKIHSPGLGGFNHIGGATGLRK